MILLAWLVNFDRRWVCRSKNYIVDKVWYQNYFKYFSKGFDDDIQPNIRVH
jgi:hypothetical protein